MTKSFTIFIFLLFCSNYSFGLTPQGVNTELISVDNCHFSTSTNYSSARLGSQKISVENNYNNPVDNSSVLILKNGFPYLLPFSKGVRVEVQKSCYIGGEIRSGLPNNWVSYQFLAEKEEAVLASRRGTVVDVQDIFFPDSSLYIRFKNQQNYVLIKHLDGSVACYMGLKKGSVKVERGQKVTPHIQLGLTAKYNTKEENQMCFILFYSNLKEEHLLSNQKYSFLNPVFYTSKGKVILSPNYYYQSDFTDDIMMKELSRREKKKYLKGELQIQR